MAKFCQIWSHSQNDKAIINREISQQISQVFCRPHRYYRDHDYHDHCNSTSPEIMDSPLHQKLTFPESGKMIWRQRLWCSWLSGSYYDTFGCSNPMIWPHCLNIARTKGSCNVMKDEKTKREFAQVWLKVIFSILAERFGQSLCNVKRAFDTSLQRFTWVS